MFENIRIKAMNNTDKVFDITVSGKNKYRMRTIIRDEIPYFLGIDVQAGLSLKNIRDIVRQAGAGDLIIHHRDSTRDRIYLSMDAVYAVISIHKDKAGAKRFQTFYEDHVLKPVLNWLRKEKTEASRSAEDFEKLKEVGRPAVKDNPLLKKRSAWLARYKKDHGEITVKEWAVLLEKLKTEKAAVLKQCRKDVITAGAARNKARQAVTAAKKEYQIVSTAIGSIEKLKEII